MKFDSKKIAKACVKATVADVQEKFSCSVATVYNACKKHGVVPFGGSERKPEIVRKYIEANPEATIADVAAALSIHSDTIKRYCEKYGFTPALPSSRVSLSTFEILHKLLTGHSQSNISRDFSVSRQWVHQVQVAAKQAGIFQLFSERK